MFADFLGPQDPRWQQFLYDSAHDFYHLPQYVELFARHENGQPQAFYAEDGDSAFLAPLVVHTLPLALGAPAHWRDAVSPYGYASPLVKPAGDAAALRRFLEAFKQRGEENGMVSAFFRLHPLYELPQAALTEYGEVVLHGETVVIDLSLSVEEMWAQTRRDHRKDIKKLIDAGFTVVMDDWNLFDPFVQIYTDTMKRLSARDFYFFSKDYFSSLCSALGEHLHLGSVKSPEGDIACAGLFVETGGIVNSYFSGSADPYAQHPQAPNKLLFDYARRWAKEAGYKKLHLGGGVGSQRDSLFEFKSGFSKSRLLFHTFRMVLDEQKYTFLNQRRTELRGDSVQDTAFFPLYRSL